LALTVYAPAASPDWFNNVDVYPAGPDVDTEYGGFNISCNGGNDGTIVMSATGGNPDAPINSGGYTFQLYDSTGLILLQSNGIGTFNGLTAGTYTVRATDVNGCDSDSALQLLTEPTVLSTTASKICGGLNCTLTALPVGGVTPYSYTWKDSGAVTVGTTVAIVVPSFPLETYDLTVTDANGCTAMTSISVP